MFLQWQRYNNFLNLQAFSYEIPKIISFKKSSSYISATYKAKIIFISVFVFHYLTRFGRLWLLLLLSLALVAVVLLATLII